MAELKNHANPISACAFVAAVSQLEKSSTRLWVEPGMLSTEAHGWAWSGEKARVCLLPCQH